ncbi:hypothetical protein N601_13535 [Rhodococcus erythropolis DN1]|nr:hypothetical protein N601_13535 [Rhodococcus erythropolis DN1]
MSLTEKRKYDFEQSMKAEQVSKLFEQIENLLKEAVELGASNQRLKLGLQHIYSKFTRER